jgi:hypothetical protein
MRTRLWLCAAFLLAGAGPVSAQYGDISDLKLLKPEDKVDVKSTPAPKGAVVLFDGKKLDGWVQRKDGKTPTRFKLMDHGVLQVQGGDSHTKETFTGPFKLHVEFRVPYEPKQAGQGRGNSGVYVQGRYEVQVLDSYGLKSKYNDCAAVYEVAAPTVNACKAPTVWQSYDIEFTPPKCKDGKVVEAARMTVYHNGVKVHDDVPLVVKEKGKEKIVTNTRAGMGGDPCKPGPIMLQDHGHPVQYRNIWLLPGEASKEEKKDS